MRSQSVNQPSRKSQLCIEAEVESNPGMDESTAEGKIANIKDADTLKKLKSKILALRNAKK